MVKNSIYIVWLVLNCKYSQKKFLFFTGVYMENLFENFIVKDWKWKWIWKNKRAINTKALYNFSLKCDDIKRGCDWMTFISMESNSLKYLCPCFNKIVNNTNSNQLVIPWDELESCPFESVSITRNTPNPKQEYFDIFIVYEWETYHIMQFWFYGDAKEWNNKIMSDFKIYWQCWRLQSILNNKFLIFWFIPSLLNWQVLDKKSIKKLLDENKIDEYIESFFIDENSDDYYILKAFSTYYLTRYDFRIDFFHPDRNCVNIPKYNAIRITKRKHWDTPFENYQPSIDTPKWYLNHDYTWYTVWKRSNKYTYLRFYHKQVDIFRTWEKTLYYDYIQYSGSVWRLEFEFGSRFTTTTKKYDFMAVMSWEFEKKIFEYLWINEKTSPFSRFYELGWVPFNEKSQFQKKIVIWQYASIWDKFYKAWINPISALIASLKMKKNYSDEEINKLVLEILNDKKLFNDTLKAFWLDII